MEGYVLPFWTEAATLFVVGLFWGSFLYVVSLSLDDIRLLFRRHSACPKCHHDLSWSELIPLVSYVIQLGRCRSCKQPISQVYPAVELGTAFLLAGTYVYLQPHILWGSMLLLLAILSIWMVILLHDARTMYVHLNLVAAAALLTIIWQFTLGVRMLIPAVEAALIAGLFLALLRLVSSLIVKKEAMGTADIYVGAMIGLLVGLPSIYVALFLAFLVGSIYGLVVLRQKRQKIVGAEVPFAPALLVGGWLALLYGPQIVSWYLGYLK